MLESLEDIKKFIEWCKENKVKEFSNGLISFELSELSFVESLNNKEQGLKLDSGIGQTLADTEEMTQDEFEELLYHSTTK